MTCMIPFLSTIRNLWKTAPSLPGRSLNGTKDYLPPNPVILDWGCGAGRIIQHLPALLPAALLYGCDINEERIEWNKEHHPGIAFMPIHSFTPMPYAPDLFDLVFGISVATHIEALLQEEWISELHRVIKPNGILLITTQGRFYTDQLLPHERKLLAERGIFTRTYPKQGHRMMSTYHDAVAFRKILGHYFTVLSFYDGALHPEKLGGQDLWILAKS